MKTQMMKIKNHRSRFRVSYLRPCRITSRLVVLWFFLSFTLLAANSDSDSVRADVKSDSLSPKASAVQGKIFVVEGAQFYDASQEARYEIVVIESSEKEVSQTIKKENKEKIFRVAKKELTHKVPQ